MRSRRESRDALDAGCGRLPSCQVAERGWVHRDRECLLDSEQSHEAWIAAMRGRFAALDAESDVGGERCTSDELPAVRHSLAAPAPSRRRRETPPKV